MRKPLSGQLAIRIHAVKDVDHAAIGRLSRGPETFVIIKVEDSFKGRTKSTRIDRWSEEVHHIDVDKANEIELTVYDKVGDHPLPIGMLWVRISDIAEEMRRKKIESEFNMAGWVSADKMGNTSPARPEYPSNMTPAQPWAGSLNQPLGAGPGSGPAGLGMPAHATQPVPQAIDAWFALEPAGRIHLTLSFGAFRESRSSFGLDFSRPLPPPLSRLTMRSQADERPKSVRRRTQPQGCYSSAKGGSARDVRTQVHHATVL